MHLFEIREMEGLILKFFKMIRFFRNRFYTRIIYVWNFLLFFFLYLLFEESFYYFSVDLFYFISECWFILKKIHKKMVYLPYLNEKIYFLYQFKWINYNFLIKIMKNFKNQKYFKNYQLKYFKNFQDYIFIYLIYKYK